MSFGVVFFVGSTNSFAGGTIRRPLDDGSDDGDDEEEGDVEVGGNDEGSRLRIGPPASSSKMDKGKGKKVSASETIEYEGDARCELCIQGDVEVCIVDRAIQEKWAKDWAAGVRRKKAPDGSMCQTCAGVHKRCALPATKEYRPAVFKRKRGVDDEVESEAKSKPVGGVKGESEVPAAKRVKVSTKVGNAVAGSSKVKGGVARLPSVAESAASAAESAAVSAAASAAALKSLNGVGGDVLVSLRLLTYLVARLVEQREDPSPRWLREEVLEAGEDPEADWLADLSAKGWSDGDWRVEGEEDKEEERLMEEFEEEFDVEDAEEAEGMGVSNKGECYDDGEE